MKIKNIYKSIIHHTHKFYLTILYSQNLAA